MNCKQGDLAVIVRATNYPEYLGRIVTCVKFNAGIGSWELDLVVVRGRKTFAYDDQLRPLRDKPGQDETLSWAPVPKKVEA